MSAIAARARPAPWARTRATAPFELLILASWIALVVWVLTGSGSGGRGGGASMPGMSSMPGMVMGAGPGAAHGGAGTAAAAGPAAAAGTAAGAGWAAVQAAIGGLPMWSLMALAMMLPVALPGLAYVAAHSYRWRRRPAMVQFAAAYLSLWVAFGALALGLLSFVHLRAEIEVAAALGIAAAWELTAPKRRALRDCHRSIPLPVDGRGASLGPARFGLVNGYACVRACWPTMLVMAVVPGGQMLFWMPVLTVLMAGEKLARRPKRAAWIVAGALAFGALIALALS